MMPDATIKAVSGGCGFTDSAAFATAFRRAVDLTRRQFQVSLNRVAGLLGRTIRPPACSANA